MPLCYSQLTLSDRRRLHQLVERKVPVGEIARQLGRHRSTIYRELKRNTFHEYATSTPHRFFSCSDLRLIYGPSNELTEEYLTSS
ncbi:helix-turn-helix domain-containing protein, partial [Sinorhizobium meliloti]|uniref:helix-turn-helix domain-containing protein n=1 Tax=Rhizobium meliloti TaxID=382 RepID=UPI001F3E3915